MAKTTKDSIGIDISKAHLDVHRLGAGAAARFENGPAGFRAFRRRIGAELPALVVFEPTGLYDGGFERAFAGTLALVKVNPLQARRFAQARGTRANTDAVDARVLAHMGVALDLLPGPPAAQNQHALKELQIAHTAMVKDRTRLLNRLKTQSLTLSRRQTKAHLALIERQLKALEAEIEAQLRACPHRSRALGILCSIPGIGPASAR